MTAPNQPVPPPGYRLLTPEEYDKPTPEGSAIINSLTGKWRENLDCGSLPIQGRIYAVPATGDTSEHHEYCDTLDPIIKGKPCNCKGRLMGDTTPEAELAALRAQNEQQAKRIGELEEECRLFRPLVRASSLPAKQLAELQIRNETRLSSRISELDAALSATAEILRELRKELQQLRDIGAELQQQDEPHLFSRIAAALAATGRKENA